MIQPTLSDHDLWIILGGIALTFAAVVAAVTWAVAAFMRHHSHRKLEIPPLPKASPQDPPPATDVCPGCHARVPVATPGKPAPRCWRCELRAGLDKPK